MKKNRHLSKPGARLLSRPAAPQQGRKPYAKPRVENVVVLDFQMLAVSGPVQYMTLSDYYVVLNVSERITGDNTYFPGYPGDGGEDHWTEFLADNGNNYAPYQRTIPGCAAYTALFGARDWYRQNHPGGVITATDGSELGNFLLNVVVQDISCDADGETTLVTGIYNGQRVIARLPKAAY